MQQSRVEIGNAINARKMIFFETFPMIFDENPDMDGLSKWWSVSQHILDPNKKLDDLK